MSRMSEYLPAGLCMILLDGPDLVCHTETISFPTLYPACRHRPLSMQPFFHHAPALLSSTLVTLAEIFAGLCFGCLLGALSAFLMIIFPPMRLWLLPLLLASQALPCLQLHRCWSYGWVMAYRHYFNDCADVIFPRWQVHFMMACAIPHNPGRIWHVHCRQKKTAIFIIFACRLPCRQLQMDYE